MDITVIARSRDRRDVIAGALRFYAKQLRLERSRWTLTVRSVSGMTSGHGMNGAVSRIGERDLMLLIDNRLSMERLFTTLAHEMVHVKQYAKGQLKIEERRGRGDFVWLGRKVVNTHYYDQPWEIEAFSRERLLSNSLVKALLGDQI